MNYNETKHNGSIRKIGKRTVGVMLAGMIVSTGLMATQTQLPLMNIEHVASAAQIDADRISVPSFEIKRATGDNVGTNIINGAWNRVTAEFTIQVDGEVKPGDTMVLNHHFKTQNITSGADTRETRFITTAQNVPVVFNGVQVGEWTGRTITFNENVESLNNMEFTLSINSQLGDYRRAPSSDTTGDTVFRVPMTLAINGVDKAEAPIQFTSMSVAPDYTQRNVWAFTGNLDNEVYNATGDIEASYGYSIRSLNHFENKGDVLYFEIDKPDGVSVPQGGHMTSGNSNGGYGDQFVVDNRLLKQSSGYSNAVKVELESETDDKIRYKLTALEDAETGFYSIGRVTFAIEPSAIGEITERRMELANPIVTTIYNEGGDQINTQTSTGFSVSGANIDADGNRLTPPVITGVQPILVSSKGQELNLMQGVDAYDEQDGHMVDKVQLTGDDKINYDKPGTYEIKYSVTDSDGMVAERSASVIVQEDKNLSAIEDRIKAESERINAELDKLQDQNDELQKQIGDLDDKLGNEVERLQTIIDNNIREIEKLKDRASDLEERMKNAEDRLDNHDDIIADINEEITNIHTEINNIKDDLRDVHATLDDHAERLDNHDARLDEHDEKLDDHEQRITDLENEVDKLNDDLSALREHSDERDDALQNAIDENQKLLQELRDALSAVQNQADDNTDRIDELEKEVDELKKKPIANININIDNSNNNQLSGVIANDSNSENTNTVTVGEVGKTLESIDKSDEKSDNSEPTGDENQSDDNQNGEDKGQSEPTDEPNTDDTDEPTSDDTADEDTPKEDAPKEDTPKEDTPKEDTPKEDAPEEETTKEETTKEETPKEEAPKEEVEQERDLAQTGSAGINWALTLGSMIVAGFAAVGHTVFRRKQESQDK